MAILRSATDLERLAGDRRVNGIARRDRVTFEIAAFARKDQLRWERTLNRYQRRCGCMAGAAFLLLTGIAGGIYLLSADLSLFSLGFLTRLVAVLLIAAAAGMAGKLTVLAITRLQFARACRRIRREIAAHPDARNAVTA
jgi:hypothetical protein